MIAKPSQIWRAAALVSLSALGAWQTTAAHAETYAWTQASRWQEEDRYTTSGGVTVYPEEWYPAKGYDVRPHAALYNMFPSQVVGDGNNQQTSNNLWAALIASPNVIGNSTTLTRARDISEDWDINFVDPKVSNKNYWADFYIDKPTTYVDRAVYPLTLTGGPQAGQGLLGNNNLLAMGDDNSLWLDADGTLSYYNYPTGTLEFDSKKTSFTTGPAGWNGATLKSKVGNLIGYEEGQLYFLEGANTVQVFNYDLGFVRTDQFSFNGDLLGQSLANVIDGKVKGYTYIGWDLGPVIIGVNAVTAAVPEASTLAMWLVGGGLLAARIRQGRKASKQA